jgi:hypothetical protein
MLASTRNSPLPHEHFASRWQLVETAAVGRVDDGIIAAFRFPSLALPSLIRSSGLSQRLTPEMKNVLTVAALSPSSRLHKMDVAALKQ